MEKNKSITIIVISIIVAATIIIVGFCYGPYSECFNVNNTTEESKFFIGNSGNTTDEINSTFFNESKFENINETTVEWMSSLKGYTITAGYNNTLGISSFNYAYNANNFSLIKECKICLINTTELNKYNLHLDDMAFIKGQVIETRNLCKGVDVCVLNNTELV